MFGWRGVSRMPERSLRSEAAERMTVSRKKRGADPKGRSRQKCRSDLRRTQQPCHGFSRNFAMCWRPCNVCPEMQA